VVTIAMQRKSSNVTNEGDCEINSMEVHEKKTVTMTN
jgi:hypothetical protein